MSKYVIELGEDAKAIQSISITSLGNVYVDSWYVENLEELNSDYINEHFGDLQDTAYQKGFEDGKAQREHDDKIEVGDEVIYNNTMKCLVVRPETDERYASLIDSNGNHHSAEHSECKKTGRHFDIASILEDMRCGQ